jgi:hypothetical protein
MQIARIPSPSDSDGDRIVVIVFGAIKPELVSLNIFANSGPFAKHPAAAWLFVEL